MLKILQSDVDPEFCKNNCPAGRTQIRCLVAGDFCKHSNPRLLRKEVDQQDT